MRPFCLFVAFFFFFLLDFDFDGVTTVLCVYIYIYIYFFFRRVGFFFLPSIAYITKMLGC